MTPKRPGIAIIYLTLAVTVLLFLLSKPSLGVLGANLFITLAQITALAGVVLFALSFILASRTYLIEEAFGGLDRAYHSHHKTGVWSFTLLVVHLASVLIGYGSEGAPIFSLLIKNPVFITGEIGIITMSAIILTIIFAKIKYQYFVLVQKFFAIPYAFGLYHILVVSSDISRYTPLRSFIITVVILGALAWIYREFFYRYFAPQAEYAVATVENKGADIVEFTLKPIGVPLKFKPGQFAYFSFHSQNVSAEPHPFSFTSSPTEPDLRFAAKAVGDFTKTLEQAKPGEHVTVYGPYGKFFAEFNPNAENIFIAGGIGVTPFLSALRNNNVCMKTSTFYTTRSENDNVFAKELDKLSCGAEAFKYFFHDSERRGYLTADIVAKRANGLDGKKIYLCGPGPMMQSLTNGFLKKGVPKDNIIFEAFNY